MPPPDHGARIDRATAELHRAMAEVRSALERATVVLAPRDEEQRQLQTDAFSGRLGPPMAELARQVAAGRTTWPDVFAGTSPCAELLRDHLTAMGERHADAVRRVLDDDPDFDPPQLS